MVYRPPLAVGPGLSMPVIKTTGSGNIGGTAQRLLQMSWWHGYYGREDISLGEEKWCARWAGC